jgi:hypothetical protein
MSHISFASRAYSSQLSVLGRFEVGSLVREVTIYDLCCRLTDLGSFVGRVAETSF